MFEDEVSTPGPIAFEKQLSEPALAGIVSSRRSAIIAAALAGAGLAMWSILEPVRAFAAPQGFNQPFNAPMPSVTSGFGWRTHPITGQRSYHEGADYSASGIGGRSIRSIAAGTVVAVGTSGGYGNSITINHAGAIQSFYGHMRQPPALSPGTPVQGGSVVGFVGSTGNSTGDHLHLNIRTNGSLVDPVAFLAGAPTADNPLPPAETDKDGTTIYIRALQSGSSGYARAGYIYANDIGGHWRGVNNLEGLGYIEPLAREGKLNLVSFNGNDLELIFATTGLWEQVPLGASAPNWSGGKLEGLGSLTGRLIYPGTAGVAGTWHFPLAQGA